MLLTSEDEPNVQETMLNDDADHIVEDNSLSMSCHALAGTLTPKTLRFKGMVNGKIVCVLVDNGSTHNFI